MLAGHDHYYWGYGKHQVAWCRYRTEALSAIFLLVCLSQIWVKKETKSARIYDISHFTTKVRRCSESNLICLSQIWVKKETKKRVFMTYPTSSLVSNACPTPSSIQILLLILFLIKWTLLAIDSDCLPKVCYLKLKKLRYLSKLR